MWSELFCTMRQSLIVLLPDRPRSSSSMSSPTPSHPFETTSEDWLAQPSPKADVPHYLQNKPALSVNTHMPVLTPNPISPWNVSKFIRGQELPAQQNEPHEPIAGQASAGLVTDPMNMMFYPWSSGLSGGWVLSALLNLQLTQFCSTPSQLGIDVCIWIPSFKRAYVASLPSGAPEIVANLRANAHAISTHPSNQYQQIALSRTKQVTAVKR